MPNLVQLIHQAVLAAHPEATVFERRRNSIRHRIADAPDGTVEAWLTGNDRTDQQGGVA